MAVGVGYGAALGHSFEYLLDARAVCVNIAVKPHTINIQAIRVSRRKHTAQLLRITALGKSVEMMDEILIWLPDAVVANAVETMKRRSGCKAPPNNHHRQRDQQHNSNRQNYSAISLNLVVFQADLFGAHICDGVSGLTLIQQPPVRLFKRNSDRGHKAYGVQNPLQPFLACGLGFRPPRFDQLRKALARSGAELSPRFGGGLPRFGAALFGPSRPLCGGDLRTGLPAHFPALARSSSTGNAAQQTGKFLLQ